MWSLINAYGIKKWVKLGNPPTNLFKTVVSWTSSVHVFSDGDFHWVICKISAGYVPSTTGGDGFVRLIEIFTAFMVLREMSNAKKGPRFVVWVFLGDELLTMQLYGDHFINHSKDSY